MISSFDVVLNEISIFFSELITIGEFTAIHYLNCLNWNIVLTGLHFSYLFTNLPTTYYSPENSMFFVKMRCGSEADEELGSISVLPCIRHG